MAHSGIITELKGCMTSLDLTISMSPKLGD